MLNKLASIDKRLFVALLSTLFMVLYAQFILGHNSACFSIQGATNSLGLSFGYSPEEVLTFFESRSAEQLQCYIHFLKVWDTLFPIIYTAMYISWMIYLLNKKWLNFSVIPIAHMITDWLENQYEIAMVNEYLGTGELSAEFVSTSSSLTIAKWILSILTYIILVSGIIYKLKQYLAKSK